MSGTSALKKIATRVKALKKKHPNAKHKTLQKQAGAEYRAGKLKTKRKPAKVKAKRKPAKRKAAKKSAKKSVVRTRTIIKVVKAKRRRYKKPKPQKRSKRVSGAGSSSLLPILAVAALGVGAYLLLKPAPLTQFPPTSNPARAAAQNNILSYAAAAGLTISAISDLIKAVSKKSDAEVIAAGSGQTNINDAMANWLSGG